MKTLYTVLLLVFSNVFMTFAWYGHLKFGSMKWFQYTVFTLAVFRTEQFKWNHILAFFLLIAAVYLVFKK